MNTKPLMTMRILKKINRLLRVISVLTLVSFLWSCTGAQLNQEMQEYTQRLARVLDTSIDVDFSLPSSDVPPPQRSDMVQVIPAVDLDLSEFYVLQRCKLNTLIAERNTSLGKTQALSQRWIYTERLIQELDACATQIRTEEPELSVKLNQWAELKRTQRETLWANLLQTSDETFLAFTQSANLLQNPPSFDHKAGISSLYFIANLPSATSDSLSLLETHLKNVIDNRTPIIVWRTQRYIHSTLQQLNLTLPDKLTEVKCPQGIASEQAKILRNVFYLFFIEKIQPLASHLNAINYQLTPVIEQLVEAPTLNPLFKQYLSHQIYEQDQHYRDAMHQHVVMWQTFFKRCNLAPTASKA